jgi:hypothetical protein
MFSKEFLKIYTSLYECSIQDGFKLIRFSHFC